MVIVQLLPLQYLLEKIHSVYDELRAECGGQRFPFYRVPSCWCAEVMTK